MLTKGLDNVPGTSGNDTIIGSIDSGSGGNVELNTLSSIDVINGGAGVDTLKVNHASGEVTLGNLSNVEIVEISSAAGEGATVDTTGVTGVTDLNVIKVAGKLDLKAAATTNISVAAKAADKAVVVAGGKNVNIDLTDIAGTGAEGSISVGSGDAADPAGTVTINATAKAAVNGVNVKMGAITVEGGTTVSVTQKVGSASGLIAGVQKRPTPKAMCL